MIWRSNGFRFALIRRSLGKLSDHDSTDSQAYSSRNQIRCFKKSRSTPCQALTSGLFGAARHCLAASSLGDRSRGNKGSFRGLGFLTVLVVFRFAGPNNQVSGLCASGWLHKTQRHSDIQSIAVLYAAVLIWLWVSDDYNACFYSGGAPRAELRFSPQHPL